MFTGCLLCVPDSGGSADGLAGGPSTSPQPTVLLTARVLLSGTNVVEILGNIEGGLSPHLAYNFDGKKSGNQGEVKWERQ